VLPGTRTYFHGATVPSSEDSARIGIIEAYACRGCGFTELYTHGAAAIPIGPEFGTELIDLPPADGPYR
jgi:hypothetical protein